MYNITIDKSNHESRILVKFAKTTWDAELLQLNRWWKLRGLYDLQTVLDDCKTFERDTSLRMSPNEERIPSTLCLKTETDCNVIVKRNRLENDETVKNHEATTQKNDESTGEIEYNPRIKWPDLTAQIFIHAGCLYGLYLVLTQAKLLTTLWGKTNFLIYTCMCVFVYIYICLCLILLSNARIFAVLTL